MVTTMYSAIVLGSTGISRPVCIFHTHDEIDSDLLGCGLLPRIRLSDKVNKWVNVTVNLTCSILSHLAHP